MRVDFTTIHNHNEQAVFDAVLAAAPGYPGLAGDAELLADVACVALNRLPPRYIRHAVDMAFYEGESRRLAAGQALQEAVGHAFRFVQARHALGARS
jgi:glutathione S-transferase